MICIGREIQCLPYAGFFFTHSKGYSAFVTSDAWQHEMITATDLALL